MTFLIIILSVLGALVIGLAILFILYYRKTTQIKEFNPSKTIRKLVKNISSKIDSKKVILPITNNLLDFVCSSLCVKAIGKGNVLGICFYNDAETSSLLCNFCEKLEIDYKGINLNTLNINLLNDFGVNFDKNLIKLPILETFAENKVIVDSISESELYIGSRRTIGDLAPLANLTITEIEKISAVLFKGNEFLSCEYTLPLAKGINCHSLDAFIRYNIMPSLEEYKKIEEMHIENSFKNKRIL